MVSIYWTLKERKRQIPQSKRSKESNSGWGKFNANTIPPNAVQQMKNSIN